MFFKSGSWYNIEYVSSFYNFHSLNTNVIFVWDAIALSIFYSYADVLESVIHLFIQLVGKNHFISI